MTPWVHPAPAWASTRCPAPQSSPSTAPAQRKQGCTGRHVGAACSGIVGCETEHFLYCTNLFTSAVAAGTPSITLLKASMLVAGSASARIRKSSTSPTSMGAMTRTLERFGARSAPLPQRSRAMNRLVAAGCLNYLTLYKMYANLCTAWKNYACELTHARPMQYPRATRSWPPSAGFSPALESRPRLPSSAMREDREWLSNGCHLSRAVLGVPLNFLPTPSPPSRIELASHWRPPLVPS